jgi:hypothetical protein
MAEELPGRTGLQGGVQLLKRCTEVTLIAFIGNNKDTNNYSTR